MVSRKQSAWQVGRLVCGGCRVRGLPESGCVADERLGL